MRVLVAYASKYGATAEIAEAIGGVLRDRGHDVTVAAMTDKARAEDADAVVAGSAVYVGRWLERAVEWIEDEAPALATKPVWLFSSGPIGEPPMPRAEQAVDVREVVEKTKARGHRLFTGRIDRAKLNFAEKAMLFALRAPTGDFRDWGAVRAWAEEIASALDQV
ncbi:MAG TPA: flavodoxin domain-containing protein [Dehalococcoidia bacterium]|nr:flavodoxin domain-containing protein [Dehalococcoidia bacterium]